MKINLIAGFVFTLPTLFAQTPSSSLYLKLDSLEFSSQEEIELIVKQNLKLDNDKSIKLYLQKDRTHSDELGYEHYAYGVLVNDVRVVNCTLKAHTFQNKAVLITGDQVLRTYTSPPVISEERAFDHLLPTLSKQKVIWNYPNESQLIEGEDHSTRPIGELVYLCKDETLELSYKYDVIVLEPLSRFDAYISATNGSLLTILQTSCSIETPVPTKYSGTRMVETKYVNTTTGYSLEEDGSGPRCWIRTQFNSANFNDFDNNWTLPNYDNSFQQNATFDVHWGSEMFYDYFMTNHNRLSWNGTDGGLNGMYRPENVDNAYYLGGSTAHFYGGDVLYRPLTSIDVVAHEWGHGIAQFEASLVNQNESGAINESLSDIWGACIKYYSAPEKNKWLMGDEIKLTGGSMRNFINPKVNNHPDTYMGQYWFPATANPNGTNDFGGIHTNSSVMNHWFYLLSDGGSGVNDNNANYSVASIGMEKAAQIVYRAEINYLTSNSTFADARVATVDAARELFGICSPEVENTIRAWHAVGVGNSIEVANSIVISNTVPSNQTVYEYAFSTITAQNSLQPSSVVVYEASNSVILSNGFTALAGSDYRASIVPCNASEGGIQRLTPIIEESQDNFSDSDLEYEVFPNPAIDIFLIKSKKTLENRKFYILSTFGEVVFQGEFSGSECTVNIANLSSGVYLILLDRSEKTKKIIKL